MIQREWNVDRCTQYIAYIQLKEVTSQYIILHNNNKHACTVVMYNTQLHSYTVNRIRYSTSPLFVYFKNQSGGWTTVPVIVFEYPATVLSPCHWPLTCSVLWPESQVRKVVIQILRQTHGYVLYIYWEAGQTVSPVSPNLSSWSVYCIGSGCFQQLRHSARRLVNDPHWCTLW